MKLAHLFHLCLDRDHPCQIVPPSMAESNLEEEDQILPQSPHAYNFVCCYSYFFTSLLLFSSLSTFSEASRSIPTTTTATLSLSSFSSLSSTNPPSTFPSKPSSHADTSKTLVTSLTISAAAVFLIVSVMVVMRCFGFRSKRKDNGIVVEKEDHVEESGEFSVKKLSWDWIERSTDGFSKVIGTGGFSNVYLARNPGPNSGDGFCSIKIHNGSERLSRVFKQELDILLRLEHHRIVKLLGYSENQEEGALVFEYVANGNLQEKLHGGDATPALPWKNRMAIAFQVAQALEYLHEKCALQIVHMDIKASNILLDENLNCKLCDFGSAKMGFSSTVQPPSSMRNQVLTMMGSPGYTDPHYLRTGIASKKNDVYSFGVLILELVTGMEAFCSEKGQFLTTLVGSRLRDGGCEAAELVDPRLGAAGFDLEEAKTMLGISATCLRQSPTLRPSATQILETIREKVSSVSFLQSLSHDKEIVY
ncbi:receptor-like protein kinase [Pyrus ussuriensis x Pyrus communis]|uniref:non-specific serine/threonine protein kinase n=1 Tax=Pyrus ussuriensis x Pyrus communis TaxID=2448454 RepID=A0A5N5HYN3_9ROSA|nr:receptor-like protein kinase [Pyrus ussuriensis x Pyrus communis]